MVIGAAISSSLVHPIVVWVCRCSGKAPIHTPLPAPPTPPRLPVNPFNPAPPAGHLHVPHQGNKGAGVVAWLHDHGS